LALMPIMAIGHLEDNGKCWPSNKPPTCDPNFDNVAAGPPEFNPNLLFFRKRNCIKSAAHVCDFDCECQSECVGASV